MQLIFARLALAAALLAALPALAKARPAPAATMTAPGAPAQSPGEIVPASIAGALLLDDAQAAQGLVALLASASQAAPSLQPKLVSQDLTRALGVDPLGSGAEAGLAANGARAIVFDPHAIGFTAPVAGEALAKQALQNWLSQLGPVRPARGAPLKGPSVSGGGDQVRAGMVAPQGGSLRLITASGRGAAALVSELAHVGHKPQDNLPLGGTKTLAAALGAVPGPARAWSRGESPVLGTLLSLNASASGLNAKGLVLAAPGAPALLEGTAPPESACAGMPLFCSRAAPGPALRALAPMFAREAVSRGLLGSQRDALDALLQNALASTKGPVLLRIEGLNARALSEPETLLTAMPASLASGANTTALVLPPKLPLPWAALPAPRSGVMLAPQTQLCVQSQAGALWLGSPCGPVPAHLTDEGGAKEIAARFDTQALAKSLRPLGALDALRGSLAAGAFAGRLLWGDLLARSGPVDLTARPSTQADGSLANALDLTFTWPLSMGAVAK